MRGRLTAVPLAKSRNATPMAAMQSRIGNSRFTSSSVMMIVTRAFLEFCQFDVRQGIGRMLALATCGPRFAAMIEVPFAQIRSFGGGFQIMRSIILIASAVLLVAGQSMASADEITDAIDQCRKAHQANDTANPNTSLYLSWQRSEQNKSQ